MSEDLDLHLHFPAKIACSHPLLFWSLALSLAKAGLLREYDTLLKCDWSEFIDEADSQILAGDIASTLFARKDLFRLQYISEGFDPSVHRAYFERLRQAARQNTDEKHPCVNWLLSQGLLGVGLDGFKAALWSGQVDTAKLLHQATKTEAEAIFYEKPERLNKEALHLLCFIAPELSSHQSLSHAMEHGASEENVLFLCWKMEQRLDRTELRYPHGNESEGLALFAAALLNGYGQVAKRLLDWCPTLGLEKITPTFLAPPWEDDAQAIRLDGSVVLTASEWATLYTHDALGRALKHHNAVPPNMSKIKALIAALAPFLNHRKPGSGASWAATKHFSCAQFAKRLWNVV